MAQAILINKSQLQVLIKYAIFVTYQEAGDEDVFRKLKADLKDQNISEEDIRNKMKEFDAKAKSDFI